MLYSIDIDGTLANEYSSQYKFHIRKEVLQKLCALLLNGDKILINTANSGFAKTALSVGYITSHVFEKEDDQFIYTSDEQKKMIENLNNNFFSCTSVGAHLQKITVPKYENLKNMDPETFKTKDFARHKTIYIKHIDKNTLRDLKEVLEIDPVFGATLNRKRWGYMDPNSNEFFPLGRVNIPYNKALPDSSRIYFSRLGRQCSAGKIIPNLKEKEFEYLQKIIAENHIKAEPIFISESSIYFGPSDCSKETPIKFLAQELGLSPKQCFHFGNEPSDIVSSKVAENHMINCKYFKNFDKPQNVIFHDNIIDAISSVQEKQNIKL